MRLPRWLTVSMLTTCTLATIGFPAWWWVTWPERTARQFVDLLGASERDAAKKMIKVIPGTDRSVSLFFQYYVCTDWNRTVLQPYQRNLRDVLGARQTFSALGWRIEVKGSELTLLNAPVGYELGYSPGP